MQGITIVASRRAIHCATRALSLTVAAALFIENMDSSVIATPRPAIALIPQLMLEISLGMTPFQSSIITSTPAKGGAVPIPQPAI